jgi:hypothetical protein
MKFSIRDLLLVTMIMALAVGWWVDSSRLTSESELRYQRIYEMTVEKHDRGVGSAAADWCAVVLA